jgi:hypothetical protein
MNAECLRNGREGTERPWRLSRTVAGELQKKIPEEPLGRAPVGFDSGADPIFVTYKEHVGPFLYAGGTLHPFLPEEAVRGRS